MDFRELSSGKVAISGSLARFLLLAGKLFVMGSKKLKLVSLLETVDQVFRRVDEGVRRNASMKYSMRDTLNCALAMFVLKSPSLLHFEEEARADRILGKNLRHLFRVEEAPSDETIRQRLDRVSPSKLQGIFKRLFALVQRTRLLERYRVLEGSYVLAVDGTGVYHSNRVRCSRCCERKHSQGRISYYHEMVMGAVVHPDKHPVLFPSGPEFVANSDGCTKERLRVPCDPALPGTISARASERSGRLW